MAIKPELSIRNDLAQPMTGLLINGSLAALGGIMWYLQFFFYAWGEASIPEHLSFANWMLHMSGYVLCGGVVGLLLAEWKGVGSRQCAFCVLVCWLSLVQLTWLAWVWQTPDKKERLMIRKAFLMSVKPDAHAEYKRRHDEIWP